MYTTRAGVSFKGVLMVGYATWSPNKKTALSISYYVKHRKIVIIRVGVNK